MTSFLDQPLRQFLELLAARTPAPGGGGAAATTLAMAAGLAAMAARFSSAQLPDAESLAGQADQFRTRAAALADSDADAYTRVLDAFALPRDGPPGERDQRIRDALQRAAEIPVEMTQIAAQVAEMAARLAAEGNPNLRGDSMTAALLAEAAARSAASLAGINVELGALDSALSHRAAHNAAAATSAAHRATSA